MTRAGTRGGLWSLCTHLHEARMIPAWAAGVPCLPDPAEGENLAFLLRPPGKLHLTHFISSRPQLLPSHLYLFPEAQS